MDDPAADTKKSQEVPALRNYSVWIFILALKAHLSDMSISILYEEVKKQKKSSVDEGRTYTKILYTQISGSGTRRDNDVLN